MLDAARLIFIFSMNSFVFFLFSYLSIRILRRKINRMTVTLSLFYIFLGVGLLLNIIFLPFFKTSFGYGLYLLILFLILSSYGFLLIFIKNISSFNSHIKWKRNYLILISYFIGVLIILLMPNNIKLNEETNWTPKFSWFFLLSTYSFFTIFIAIPFVFYAKRIISSFEDIKLKRRFNFFIIGSLGLFLAFYGVVLYNTWFESIFRIIWLILAFSIMIPAGILIYYGIGHKL
jgi:hypothetical protein